MISFMEEGIFARKSEGSVGLGERGGGQHFESKEVSIIMGRKKDDFGEASRSKGGGGGSGEKKCVLAKEDLVQ